MDKILEVFKLIPVIIELIKAIEQAIPGESKGEAKLVAVREILEIVDVGTKNLWPQISLIISVLVKTFNTTGVFSK